MNRKIEMKDFVFLCCRKKKIRFAFFVELGFIGFVFISEFFPVSTKIWIENNISMCLFIFQFLTTHKYCVSLYVIYFICDNRVATKPICLTQSNAVKVSPREVRLLRRTVSCWYEIQALYQAERAVCKFNRKSDNYS